MADPFYSSQPPGAIQAGTTGVVGQHGLNWKRLAGGALAVVAGILASVTTVLPWWSMTGTGFLSPSVTISFFPGNSLTASESGNSASGTYAAAHLSQVGTVYSVLLALLIAVILLSLLVGALSVVASLGRIRNPARYKTIRNLGMLTVFVAIMAVILVPLAQPYAFHNANPSGVCASTAGLKSPCNAFWGDLNSGSTTISWGADDGWYSAIATVVFLVAAVVVWVSSSSEPWGRPMELPIVYAPGAPMWQSAPRDASADLDRLVQLKQLADSGHITQAEFQQVKVRILGIQASAPAQPAGVTNPEDDLRRLKSMHDSGVITDQEYDELRRRVLARF